MFNKKYVEMVLQGKLEELQAEVEKKLNRYIDGAQGLRVYWVPIGTVFRINEYDGNESLETYDLGNYFVA
jgi:hypothetical protein